MRVDGCARLAGVLLTGAVVTAHAARPLATDDAGVAASGSCQIEAWVEQAPGERAEVLAGACGVAEGLELGVEATRTRPRGDKVADATIGLKWAPEALVFDTGLGRLRLGAKAGLATTQPVAGGWKLSGAAAAALASLEWNSELGMHFNVGPQHDRESGRVSTLLHMAATWTPCQSALLFAELALNDHRASDGGAIRTAGARWWLVHEKLGIDLSASRTVGSAATVWSLGFGWYGLGK